MITHLSEKVVFVMSVTFFLFVFLYVPQSSYGGFIYTDFCVEHGGCSGDDLVSLSEVEKSIIKLKHVFQEKPIFLVASQVQHLLGRIQQSGLEVQENTKINYLRRRLEQRDNELREKMQTIAISPRIVRQLRTTYGEDTEFFHAIRQYLIVSLVHTGFPDFVHKPYGPEGGIFLDEDGAIVVDKIVQDDDLDVFIRQWWSLISGGSLSLYLTPTQISEFGSLFLFKTTEDLQKLGYELISHRERINTDPEYRRHNITTAFTHMGPIRVLLPGETLSFLYDSDFDMEEKLLYKWGTVIASDEEVIDYGGGLCGAATALYQGTVTNRGLLQEARNHSKRYTNLYAATIDGTLMRTPGMDATIYSPSLDLKITNIRPYPIILVMSYDGTHGGSESVFTLGKEDDKGSLEYLGKKYYATTLHSKEDGPIEVWGECHRWLINDVWQQKCYKEVKP